ncbi:hypothetical protein MINT15_11160 [Saccharomonospora viridis]|uniref:Uncharacterized protein n=1 Tax=Saccharomonospora viridis TaxID=1852 RepID=A0A837DCY3_9PSEU|nr:hypothetical protein MINT15_11160 [Saccharomonospora viridis]
MGDGVDLREYGPAPPDSGLVARGRIRPRSPVSVSASG